MRSSYLAIRCRTSSFDTRCRLIVLMISVAKRATSTNLLLLFPMGHHLLLQTVCCRKCLVPCGAWGALCRFYNHTWTSIDNSLRKVATSNSLMIYSLFPTHMLGRVDPSLREINWIAHMLHAINNPVRRLYVKLCLYCVQRVLLLAHEAQWTTLEANLGSGCTTRWNFSLHGRRRFRV